MTQAIHTRYLGATNHRGERVVAVAAAGRLVVPWDYALSAEQNHRAAADQFATRYLRPFPSISGSGTLADGSWVHTLTEGRGSIGRMLLAIGGEIHRAARKASEQVASEAAHARYLDEAERLAAEHGVSISYFVDYMKPSWTEAGEFLARDGRCDRDRLAIQDGVVRWKSGHRSLNPDRDLYRVVGIRVYQTAVHSDELVLTEIEQR